MTYEIPSMRWGVEQRLEFIEFRLLWEGGVNRSDIKGPDTLPGTCAGKRGV